MAPESPTPRRQPPPSFTPQAGRPSRPSVRNASGLGTGETPQPAPHVVPVESADPVSGRGAGSVSSNAPRAGASGRVAARGATPPPPAPAARPASIPPRRSAARPADPSPPQPPTQHPHRQAPATATRASAPPPLPPDESTLRPEAARAAASSGSAAPGTPRNGSRPSTPAGQPQAGGRKITSSAPGTRAAARPASSGPGGRPPGAGGPGRPSGGPGEPPASGPGRRKPRWGRIAAVSLALLLVCAIAWPVGLVMWANGKINHVDALSSAAQTPGTTYLLAGSDSREDGAIYDDGTTGARTDTVMVLHVPDSGPSALISLPRDSYVEIPGYKPAKLNAAFTMGGAPLLVQTVESMTGIKVDHYVEVGLGGVEQIVDAVGGVELCLDYDVDDPKSELVWAAGCHTVDGKTALAFSRMRYSDPKGDIGRAERQRQVISAVSSKVQDKSILVKPWAQTSLIDSGLSALTVDEDMSLIDLGRLALAFRNANGPDGITGTPPISNLDYRPGNIGSAVLLNPDTSPQFWSDISMGTLPPGVVGGLP